ncbi:uncharacterized protein TNCV_1573881 [Trichonephila clavipes]|nr:uncharacterized protein TNCV_1573881 [Trichonephila clavipes]
MPYGLGSNPGEDMDVCKCIVPLRQGVTLNSRRTASPLVCLVEGVERVLKATANDRRHLALCHDEFRGPRFGICRSGSISNNNKKDRSVEGFESSLHVYSKISALLTLTKILISPDELIYITKMRNLILFQISGADYQYLEYKFKHDFTFAVGKGSLLFRCFYHAFSKVAKFQVLVHNFKPFRYWKTNTIDENGHRVALNFDRNEVEMEIFEDEITLQDLFLVAAINNLFSDTSLEYWNYRSLPYVTKVPLSIREACSKTVLYPAHESTWRRLYDANDTIFNCEEIDCDLYEREQMMNLRSVSVFREIKKKKRNWQHV